MPRRLIFILSFILFASRSFATFVDSHPHHHDHSHDDHHSHSHMHLGSHSHHADALIHDHFNLGVDLPGRINPLPGKWGSAELGTNASVTWSFMATGLETDRGPGASIALGEFLPVGFEAEVARAFDVWSRYVGIDFIQVEDPNTGWQAPGAELSDIRIGGQQTDGAGNIIANAFFPPLNGGAAAGDIHLDVSEEWKIGFGGSGFDIFQTMTHEIGHAIGLAHTSLSNALMNPLYSEVVPGPQWDDIMGAQHLYGKRGGHNSQVPDEESTWVLLGMSGVGLFLLRAFFYIKFFHKKKRTHSDSLSGLKLA